MKAHVKEVINGSTFRTDLGKNIRLAGVRAPKLGRPDGQRAKQVLDELIGGVEVTIKSVEVQRKQIVATVRVGGLSVNEEMRRRLGRTRVPSPSEMPGEPMATFVRLTDLCDGFGEVLNVFDKNFGKSCPGRLKSNPDLINKLVEHQQRIPKCDEATRKKLFENLHKIVPVVSESFEILIGCDWLFETGNEGCLILYNEGGVLARLSDENAGTPSNEDLCYHISSAARLHYAGGTSIKIDTNLNKDKAQKCPVAVIPDGRHHPDVAGIWKKQRVVIECKRVSQDADMSQVKACVEVAEKKMGDGDLRIISIDASGAIYQPKFLERPWGDGEIVRAVGGELHRMGVALGKTRSKCNELIVEATVPFAQGREGPSSCKFLWGDFNKFPDFFHLYGENPMRKDNTLLRPRRIGDGSVK